MNKQSYNLVVDDKNEFRKVILTSNKLNKVYTNNKNSPQHILKDVNLQIRSGEFVSIMGPSGSGKSTLLYNISGMDQASSGTVCFYDKEIFSLSDKELTALRLNKMGFIFQQIHLLKNLCIFDNVILPAYSAKNGNRKNINKKALELMSKMGISDLKDNDITQASGGQLQRVAICRALINDPDIIFGDEPTGALDAKSANEVMDILSNINQRGTTILLVTHDIKIAAKTDKIFYIFDGKIMAEKYLGRCSNEVNILKEREMALFQWLSGLGF